MPLTILAEVKRLGVSSLNISYLHFVLNVVSLSCLKNTSVLSFNAHSFGM